MTPSLFPFLKVFLHLFVLRVGLHRYLAATLGYELARVHYKFIICIVLSQMLAEITAVLPPDITIFQVAKLSRRIFKLHRESHEVAAQLQKGTVRCLSPAIPTNHRERQSPYLRQIATVQQYREATDDDDDIHHLQIYKGRKNRRVGKA